MPHGVEFPKSILPGADVGCDGCSFFFVGRTPTLANRFKQARIGLPLDKHLRENPQVLRIHVLRSGNVVNRIQALLKPRAMPNQNGEITCQINAAVLERRLLRIRHAPMIQQACITVVGGVLQIDGTNARHQFIRPVSWSRSNRKTQSIGE